MNQKFVVIEGLDGSGKSTQIGLLQKFLMENDIQTEFIHFPRLNSGLYGTMIAEFLRGEYGGIESVHPKLVALLFANDRAEHKELINSWLNSGKIVLADRYVYSNIAYQCAKCPTESEADALRKWILNYEFEILKLPTPTEYIYLDLPMKIVAKNLSEARSGEDRTYLNGKEDIHEANESFLQKVWQQYQKLIKSQPHIKVVSCSDSVGNFRSREEIHMEIRGMLLGER